MWKFWKALPIAKRRSGRLLVGFFSLMLLFTLLSRGLDSFTVARVSAALPGFGTLTHKIKVQGSVEPLAEIAVALPDGFMVRQILAEEGNRITKGDLLVVLDTDSITRQLEQAKRELSDAQLTAAAKAVKAEQTAADPLAGAQRQLERAKEDDRIAKSTARSALSWAKRDLQKARQERRRLLDDDCEDEELEAIQKEIAGYRRAVELAKQALKKTLTDGQRAVEDAENALTDAECSQLAAQRSKELEGQQDGIGIAEKQARVTEFSELLAAEGKVYAAQNGVVTALKLHPGDVTGLGGAFLLSEQGEGCLFTAKLSKEQAERLSPGTRVEVDFVGAKGTAGSVLLVTPPEKTGSEYGLRVVLPKADQRPGTGGTLQTSQKSSAQGILLPLTALHSEGGLNSGYVFVLREKDSTMGTQLVAERRDVTILDRNDSNAMVQGAFAPDEKIITDSSRYLVDGDRVRLIEDAL